MKLHKNFIFASALMLATGLGLALTSCNDDDENLPAHFKADNREFTIEYDGLDTKGEEPSFTLNSSGNWSVSQKTNGFTFHANPALVAHTKYL